MYKMNISVLKSTDVCNTPISLFKNLTPLQNSAGKLNPIEYMMPLNFMPISGTVVCYVFFPLPFNSFKYLTYRPYVFDILFKFS